MQRLAGGEEKRRGIVARGGGIHLREEAINGLQLAGALDAGRVRGELFRAAQPESGSDKGERESGLGEQETGLEIERTEGAEGDAGFDFVGTQAVDGGE